MNDGRLSLGRAVNSSTGDAMSSRDRAPGAETVEGEIVLSNWRSEIMKWEMRMDVMLRPQ